MLTSQEKRGVSNLYISILLSRHFDRSSKFLYYLTGKNYTHASIGLSEDSETFYSFNGKGFRIEKPKRWKARDEKTIVTEYQLEVSDEEYQKVKDFIEVVRAEQGKYKYNTFGVIMSLMHIPVNIKYKYFCSQFVATVLEYAGILKEDVPPSLYLPNSFLKTYQLRSSTPKVYC